MHLPPLQKLTLRIGCTLTLLWCGSAIAQAQAPTRLLPWRQQMEHRMQELERGGRAPQQDQLHQRIADLEAQLRRMQSPQPIAQNHYYYVPPRQELPIAGMPRQELPIPGAPRIDLPIPGTPRQELPAPGAPLQDLPKQGLPKQVLPAPLSSPNQQLPGEPTAPRLPQPGPPTGYQRFTWTPANPIMPALDRPPIITPNIVRFTPN